MFGVATEAGHVIVILDSRGKNIRKGLVCYQLDLVILLVVTLHWADPVFF